MENPKEPSLLLVLHKLHTQYIYIYIYIYHYLSILYVSYIIYLYYMYINISQDKVQRFIRGLGELLPPLCFAAWRISDTLSQHVTAHRNWAVLVAGTLRWWMGENMGDFLESGFLSAQQVGAL